MAHSVGGLAVAVLAALSLASGLAAAEPAEKSLEGASRLFGAGEGLLRDALKNLQKPATMDKLSLPVRDVAGPPAAGPKRVVQLGSDITLHTRPGTEADFLEFVEAEFTNPADGDRVRARVGLGLGRSGWPIRLDIWEANPTGETHGKYSLSRPVGAANLTQALEGLNQAYAEGALRPGTEAPLAPKAGRIILSFKFDNRELNMGMIPGAYDDLDETFEFDLDSQDPGVRKLVQALRQLAFD